MSGSKNNFEEFGIGQEVLQDLQQVSTRLQRRRLQHTSVPQILTAPLLFTSWAAPVCGQVSLIGAAFLLRGVAACAAERQRLATQPAKAGLAGTQERRAARFFWAFFIPRASPHCPTLALDSF